MFSISWKTNWYYQIILKCVVNNDLAIQNRCRVLKLASNKGKVSRP